MLSAGALLSGWVLGDLPALSLCLLPIFAILLGVLTHPGLARHSWTRPLCLSVIGVLCFLLAIHFFDWRAVVLDPALDLGGELIRWYANLDKPFAGAMIALALLALGRPGHLLGSRPTKPVLMLIVSGLASLILLSLALGATVSITLTAAAGLFLLGNLFLTVFPEELFFRGLIQAHLPRGPGWRDGLSILVTALLFTAVHYSPTLHPSYGLLVLTAGLLYAAVFQFSRSIGLSILVHLAVNAISVVLFSYPLNLDEGAAPQMLPETP